MEMNLKTWPEPFAAVRDGRKPFEYRPDDRGFAAGDILHLLEWNPDNEQFTGERETRRVTFVLRAPAFGVPEGYCVLGLADDRANHMHEWGVLQRVRLEIQTRINAARRINAGPAGTLIAGALIMVREFLDGEMKRAEARARGAQ